jgi:hypothetical protein
VNWPMIAAGSMSFLFGAIFGVLACYFSVVLPYKKELAEWRQAMESWRKQ